MRARAVPPWSAVESRILLRNLGQSLSFFFSPFLFEMCASLWCFPLYLVAEHPAVCALTVGWFTAMSVPAFFGERVFAVRKVFFGTGTEGTQKKKNVWVWFVGPCPDRLSLFERWLDQAWIYRPRFYGQPPWCTCSLEKVVAGLFRVCKTALPSRSSSLTILAVVGARRKRKRAKPSPKHDAEIEGSHT